MHVINGIARVCQSVALTINTLHNIIIIIIAILNLELAVYTQNLLSHPLLFYYT